MDDIFQLLQAIKNPDNRVITPAMRQAADRLIRELKDCKLITNTP